jgi:hypothetical protein
LYIKKPLTGARRFAGLVRGTNRTQNTTDKGFEPFRMDETGAPGNAFGIEIACQQQMNDAFSCNGELLVRRVWHVEMKIPFHTGLWTELERGDYFDEHGFPRTGRRFKMNFSNNDKDSYDSAEIAAGHVSKYIQLDTKRNSAFWEAGDSVNVNWWNTKYFPVFKFSNQILIGPTPWPYWDGGPKIESAEKKGGSALGLRASPNPFNPSTRISVSGGAGPLKVEIFNVAGIRVAGFSAAKGDVVWNATGFPSGLYIVQAVRGGLKSRQLIVLQK